MASAPNLDVKILIQVGEGAIVEVGTVTVPVRATLVEDGYGKKNGLAIDLGYLVKNLRDRYGYELGTEIGNE